MDHPPLAAPKVYLPAVAFAVLAVAVVVLGWLYQRQQQRLVEARAESQLLAIADLKVREVVAWRAERLQDARDLASNPFLAREIERGARSSYASVARELKPWLDYLAGFREYTDIAFVDAQKNLIVTQHPSLFPLRPFASAHLTAAFDSGGPLLSDVVREDEHDAIHLDLAVAVLQEGRPGAPAAGAILYRVDPTYQLFPRLQSWPTASATAETLLVRSDGDDQVLFLNELRHRKGTALNLRLSRASAKASIQEREGVLHGLDYRGVPIIAATSQVPGTPWVLVAKIDLAEVLAPARERTRATLTVVLTMLAVIAVGLWFWWRQERAALLAHRYRQALERQKLLRRAEEALVASEEHLRLTLDSIGDAVIATDAQGCIERMNPVAERLTGWRLKECRGLPLSEVFRTVNDETHQPLENPATRILREGAAMGLASPALLVSRDGHERPIADSGAPIRDSEGRIAGVVVVFRDATEERTARALAAFQNRLLATLHDAVIGIDPDLRIRTWNAAAEHLYGWTAQEAVGRNAVELLRTDFSAEGFSSVEEIKRTLDETGRVHAELPQQRRDDTRILAEIEAAVLRGSDGHPVGYLLVARDVTDRHRTEEALRASEAKFRAAFHNAGLGTFIVDRQWRMLECNRAFLEMMQGFSEEELRRMQGPDVIHPSDLSRSRVCFEDLLSGSRDSIVDEPRMRRKDGSYAQCLLRASAVRKPSGEILYVIGVIEDVTQRRMMEAQLLFADRMSAIGTMAAGVAHELNNPLAFILANLTYALDELRKEMPNLNDLTHALREARDGAERSRDIVRDLKIFSRPDEERRAEAVDVRDALRSAINLAQNEIRHRAQLIQDLREVPAVAATAHRLGQVFLNLLVNAAQAIPEGRAQQNQIRVATRLSDDGRVEIDISDTGQGISPEDLTRIFEPFYTTKPVGVGTGLGLSICHGIVDSLGGEILVESVLGEGSTFRVFLPQYCQPDSDAAAPRPIVPAALRGRILVVDDEPLVGRAVYRILSPLHEVICQTSAQAALDQIEKNGGFDLVLCDLMMPDMTGIDMYQRLAETRPEVSRRMVFLSGGAFTDQAREFLGRVPNARLEKPFDPQALRNVISELLNKWKT